MTWDDLDAWVGEEHPISRFSEDEDLVIANWQTEARFDQDGYAAPAPAGTSANDHLEGKTHEQFIGLIGELEELSPEVGQAMAEHRRIASGDAQSLVKRLRREIREIVREPGWLNHSEGGGFIPDFSGIRRKLEALLKAGCADEVLNLGEDSRSVPIPTAFQEVY